MRTGLRPHVHDCFSFVNCQSSNLNELHPVSIGPPLYDPRFFFVFSCLKSLPLTLMSCSAAFLPHLSKEPSWELSFNSCLTSISSSFTRLNLCGVSFLAFFDAGGRASSFLVVESAGEIVVLGLFGVLVFTSEVDFLLSPAGVLLLDAIQVFESGCLIGVKVLTASFSALVGSSSSSVSDSSSDDSSSELDSSFVLAAAIAGVGVCTDLIAAALESSESDSSSDDSSSEEDSSFVSALAAGFDAETGAFFNSSSSSDSSSELESSELESSELELSFLAAGTGFDRAELAAAALVTTGFAGASVSSSDSSESSSELLDSSFFVAMTGSSSFAAAL